MSRHLSDLSHALENEVYVSLSSSPIYPSSDPSGRYAELHSGQASATALAPSPAGAAATAATERDSLRRDVFMRFRCSPNRGGGTEGQGDPFAFCYKVWMMGSSDQVP